MLHNDNDEEDNDASQLFPETETRQVAERFAPLAPPRAVSVEGVRAIEEALRKQPDRPVFKSLYVVLDERKKIHGEFVNDARTAQRLKGVMRDTANWDALTDVQHEALEQIATKIGRILSGSPNHSDHWNDIQGYARLVEERL